MCCIALFVPHAHPLSTSVMFLYPLFAPLCLSAIVPTPLHRMISSVLFVFDGLID